MLLGPDAVSGRSPLVSVGAAAAENIVRRFRLLHIGAVGAGTLDHLTQQLGVLEHRAGAQVVVVEGLALVVLLEQRLLQALQQALVVDVRVGVVDKDAGLNVARRVDVAYWRPPAMQPSMYSPSFWKSMQKIGLPPV